MRVINNTYNQIKNLIKNVTVKNLINLLSQNALVFFPTDKLENSTMYD